MGKGCCVCLENDPNLCLITETNNNDCTIASKLRSCVAEIEWKDTYLICPHCSISLDSLYEFREKCLSAENLRNQEDAKEALALVKRPNIEAQEKEIKFQCEFCEGFFKTRMQLMRHSVDEHRAKVKPFTCHLCSNKFANPRNLNQHLSYHREDRNFMCTFCGKSYKTFGDLHVHEKIHLNSRSYKCDKCKKSFNTHKNLYTHNIVVHTDRSLWNHTCQICSRKFPMKSSYDAHMRRHNNDRRFGCHLCNKKFFDKATAQKHLLSHSNNREYKCDICQKEYKVKRIMEIHKRKSHGVGDVRVPERKKKFLCHLCPKAYCDRNKLRRHTFSHTGEKPYSCTECPKRYVDVSYLNQHKRRVHGDVKKLETRQ